MNCLRLARPGGLDALNEVALEDPGPPKPIEVRVRIRASSLNFHDLGVVTGRIPAEDGRIPMSDGAGVVEAVGDGVTEFAPGDSVVSCFFPFWLDGEPGATASFALTPGDGIDGYCRRWW
jgi:NADPH:quinone reductase-like Zn-dependent oxidoreductase